MPRVHCYHSFRLIARALYLANGGSFPALSVFQLSPPKNQTPHVRKFGMLLDLSPGLRQANKTLFAVGCKFIDRQDHFSAF